MALLRNIIIASTAILVFVFSLARFLPGTDVKNPEVNVSIAATTSPVLVATEMSAATSSHKTERPRVIVKKITPPKILTPPRSEPPHAAPSLAGGATSTNPQAEKPAEKIPPVNEDELMRAVVRVRCGDIYGSGFVVNSQGLVLTAGHVLIDAIDTGASSCDVIFPKKNADFGFYSAAIFREGSILTPAETAKSYKHEGFDVGALQTAPYADEQIFTAGFPYVRYPFCGADTLDDKIILFGYAANVGTNAASFGSVLSRFEGGVLQYGNITGVKSEPSTLFSGGFDFIPTFDYTLDTTAPHPAVIIYSNNNFAGASGGLVFDVSKNCIIGANSAVGTIAGDPRVFGFIYNFNFPKVRQWLDALGAAQ